MVPHRSRSIRDPRNIGRGVSAARRMLARSPGITATALIALAVGMSAIAGVFSLIDQLSLRALPGVSEPERLVLLQWNGPHLATEYGRGPLFSYPVCRELQARRDVFDGVFCRHPTPVNLSTGQSSDLVGAEIVSGSYFSVLGVRPALGRLIDPSDDREPGAHPVVVVSYDYWTTQLGGASDAIGRQVLVNSHPMTVIGVAPASFRGVDPGAAPVLWIPAAMQRQAAPEWDRLLDRRAAWLHVFGRLEPGMTIAQASAGLREWFSSMLDADAARADFPSVTVAEHRQFLASTLDLRPAARGWSALREKWSRALWGLLGATVLLVLWTIWTAAGLLADRGAARTRAWAARTAGSRRRVVRRLAFEGALIAAGAAGLGLVTAPLVSHLLRSLAGHSAGRVDARTIVLSLAVCVVTGIVFAVASLVQIRRVSTRARADVRASRVPRRAALVIGQMACTAALLIGAGLIVRWAARLHATIPAPTQVVMFDIAPQEIGHADAEARRIMGGLQRTLERVPGVERVAVANVSLLTDGSVTRGLTIEADRRLVTNRHVRELRVGPGFFATLGTRIVAGRDFEARDARPADDGAGYRAVIVDQSFARRYFGTRDPIGRRIGIGTRPDTATAIEIVGVIEDLNYRGQRLTQTEAIFFPFWDLGSEHGTFYVALRGDPIAALPSLDAAVAAVDRTLPVTPPMTFDDHGGLSPANAARRPAPASGFSSLALLFSVGGLSVLTIAAVAGGLAMIAFAMRDRPASREAPVEPSETLIGDFTSLVQRAASFPGALQAVLALLSGRIDAQFLLLLEKRAPDEYGHESLSLPAHGLLVTRLTRYPHPLPLAHGDYESWLRWARESKPAHVAEIERLRAGNVRMAMALRTSREIVAVLLAGPSRRHRAFTEAERQVFQDAAEVLALMIENARLNERALEQEKVRRDLALAAEVQRRLMPRQSPACARVSFAAFTLPARTIGGDYYDFLDLGDERIGIAVADVSGKGIAAALLMSVVQASLRAVATEPDIASAPLAARLNRFLYQSTDMRHYATFFYAQLDPAGGRLRYVNAGHNPPYLLRRNGAGLEIHDLTAGGMVLGLFDDAAYEEGELDLRPGDLFVAFTDGVTEARDTAGEEFGEERLKQLLGQALGGSAEDVAATLAHEMRRWTAGAEQHDDLTFVVAAVHDAPRAHDGPH